MQSDTKAVREPPPRRFNIRQEVEIKAPRNGRPQHPAKPVRGIRPTKSGRGFHCPTLMDIVSALDLRHPDAQERAGRVLTMSTSEAATRCWKPPRMKPGPFWSYRMRPYKPDYKGASLCQQVRWPDKTGFKRCGTPFCFCMTHAGNESIRRSLVLPYDTRRNGG